MEEEKRDIKTLEQPIVKFMLAILVRMILVILLQLLLARFGHLALLTVYGVRNTRAGVVRIY